MKQAWNYVIAIPFTWLFYCFFQPARFRRECETTSFLKRTIAMLRLALPMFLCSYPFALLMHMIGGRVPGTLVNPVSIDTVNNHHVFVIVPSVVHFFLAIAVATVVAVVWGVLWGIAGGVTGGIAWGIALSIAGGIGSGAVGRGQGFVAVLETGVVSGILVSVILGTAGGIVGGIARFIVEKKNAWKGIVGGAVGGIVGGIVGVTIGNIAGSILLGQSSIVERNSTSIYLARLGIIAGGIAGSLAGSLARFIAEKRGVGEGIVGIVVGGIAGIIVAGINVTTAEVLVWGVINGGMAGIAGGLIGALVSTTVEVNDKGKGIVQGLMILIAGSLFLGVIYPISVAMGIALAIAMGVILGVVRPSAMSIAVGIAVGIQSNFFSTSIRDIGGLLPLDLALITSAIVGYYRLPLYPVSGLSAFRAYLASRKNPPQVFTYLHRSSLYWDERIFLPLPGLKRTLLLAAEQNVEQTREEIAFIVAERPQQINAARAASLEIAIHDMEMREDLSEIAQASQRLTDLLPQEAGLIDPRWVTPLVRLQDASRDAARACSPLGWQARRSALQEMIVNLKKVYPNTAFPDAHLNTRLAGVIKTWRAVAQHELEVLEYAPEKTSRIDNPYNPGPALELRDSLFVGRRDLAQQLGESLSKGSRRPTFLLQGERRMGKSSTLKQLPNLLGARYLPIFYDLQMRGFSASIAVFLGRIADEIYKVMHAQGISTRRLAYEQLQDASRKNEAEVYYQFERWFEFLERTLEQEDRTLLLTFDEFEKLEDAGQRGHLDLELLLDWLRSVIQNHPRLALLFSGVRSFGDMGTNWAGYFVNVQTLKVSFLHSDEAHQLITRPIPYFPGEEIFGKGVVEEIMRMTNCHPFLIQAVCSALLDALNADKRNRIELPHVRIAANQVLKNWGSTYFRDLWERSDENQRMCITVLEHLGAGDLFMIEQQSGLDGRTVHRTLETLLERDIAVCEQDSYRIAVPLFAEWVERSGYR